MYHIEIYVVDNISKIKVQIDRILVYTKHLNMQIQ